MQVPRTMSLDQLLVHGALASELTLTPCDLDLVLRRRAVNVFGYLPDHDFGILNAIFIIIAYRAPLVDGSGDTYAYGLILRNHFFRRLKAAIRASEKKVHS